MEAKADQKRKILRRMRNKLLKKQIEVLGSQLHVITNELNAKYVGLWTMHLCHWIDFPSGSE